MIWLLVSLVLRGMPLQIHQLTEQPTIIYKNGWSREDPRQELVQEAFDLGGMDHVILLECENNWWEYKTKGDWWHAVWLCQINNRFHNIPQQYYTDPHFQVQYCYKLRQWWTKFYWPQRPKSKTDTEKCWSFSKKYFTILTWWYVSIRTNSDEP